MQASSSKPGSSLCSVGEDLVSKYLIKERGEVWLTETYHDAYREEDSKIDAEEVEYSFESPNRKLELTEIVMREKLEKVNSIGFPQAMVLRLRVKLMLSYREVGEYVKEYRKYLYLIALSNKMVTPSEQVDHVWHLHQSWDTKAYRESTKSLYGKLLRHCPSLGGH